MGCACESECGEGSAADDDDERADEDVSEMETEMDGECRFEPERD